MKIDLTWEEFKNIISSKILNLQFIENDERYTIFAIDTTIEYETVIYKDLSNVLGIDITENNDNKTDFENNFKNEGNKSLIPKDIDGKQFIRAESRPLNRTTYFTMAGDSEDDIGDGQLLCWDFSNDDDLLSVQSGSPIKTKRIEFSFIDAVNIKEGTIYFKDMIFGSYIDLKVVCPNGSYYLKNNGTPALASEDTVINHFVNKHHMLDTCILGDELNTEASSNEIPNNYKFWLDITVPNTDTSSKGYVSIELYRDRTVIL